MKVIVILVQNHGFASIGSLSESLGFAAIRHRVPLPRRRRSTGRREATRRFAVNAASLGAEVIRVTTAAEFADAVKVAKANEVTTVIHVETDPLVYAPDSQSWWDVPVSQSRR